MIRCGSSCSFISSTNPCRRCSPPDSGLVTEPLFREAENVACNDKMLVGTQKSRSRPRWLRGRPKSLQIARSAACALRVQRARRGSIMASAQARPWTKVAPRLYGSGQLRPALRRPRVGSGNLLRSAPETGGCSTPTVRVLKNPSGWANFQHAPWGGRPRVDQQSSPCPGLNAARATTCWPRAPTPPRASERRRRCTRRRRRAFRPSAGHG